MQRLLFIWLMLTGIGHSLLGLALAFTAKLALAAPYFDYLHARFGVAPRSNPEQVLLATMVQLSGPTVASWGVLFSSVVYLYRKHGHPLCKYAIYASLLLWLPLDSLISAYYSLYAHVYLNLSVALLIILPLLALRPEARRT
ncbi:MAG: hypothetical protein ACRERY_05695 [Pseudomonas sp.]